MRHRPLLTLTVAVFLASVTRASDTEPRGIELFEKKIRPALVQHCYGCHSAEAEKNKKLRGGLHLDTQEGLRKGGDSGPAIVPGKPEESRLLKALHYADPALRMPPKGKLPDTVLADFEAWVKMGAPDPRDGKEKIAKKPGSDAIPWAFLKPVKPAVPAVKDGNWPRGDIDRFVLAKLEEKGLRPNGEADRQTLLRRLSFALLGLPPSPAEIEAFLNDRSSDALDKVVDRLLRSPHFGERWGRHWLDVAHYAENSGTVLGNTPYPQAWRYRDYVIAAFNKDKPYDQFIREQIAGDILPSKTDAQFDEQLIATGFLVMGRLRVGNRISLAIQMDNIDEQIDATTQGFLGLTVSCARCHDHKFDPITQKDYYALGGIFKSTTPLLAFGNVKNALSLKVGTPRNMAMGVQEGPVDNCRLLIRGEPDEPADEVARGLPVIFTAGKPLVFKANESGRLQLAEWLASPDNPLTARVMVNRVWHHLMGRGLVPSVDNFGAMGESCSNQALLDYLAVRFVEEGWSVKKLIRSIVLSRTFQLSSRFDKANFDLDPENLFHWRHNQRRLEAEAIRDAMLAASGRFVPTPLKDRKGIRVAKTGVTAPSSMDNQRSVYLPVQREKPPEMLRVFDFADPSLVLGRREVTTVPIQALFMMNNPFVLDQSRDLANRLLGPRDLDDAGRIALGFQLCFGRTPSASELERVQTFLANYGEGEAGSDRKTRAWISFCQTLFESAEFRYVR